MTVKKKKFDIWAGHTLPLVGLTGGHNSGKTFFGISIDPTNTVVYDFEKSAIDYQNLGFKYYDMRRLSREAVGRRPSPIDVFTVWYDIIEKIKPNEFSVALLDPITDCLEAGMVEYVSSQYATYGFKSQGAFERMEGVFWARVRSFWEELLLDITDRVETLVYTAHMKVKYSDGRPTKELIMKGKSTLQQLTSLCLRLDRSPERKGGSPRKVPTAVVEKYRTLEPFPPRLPEATPDAVRYYLEHPADFANLSEDEIVSEGKLSDEEKLEAEASIESDRKVTAEANLAAATLNSKAAKARELAMAAAKEGE